MAGGEKAKGEGKRLKGKIWDAMIWVWCLMLEDGSAML
jgi:hypothetical protein